jgi:hypothetical protein
MSRNNDGRYSNALACEILLKLQTGHFRHLQISDETISTLHTAKPAPRQINGSGLLRGGYPRRTGRRHLQIRRALIIAAGRPITTREMFAAVHPEIELGKTQPDWRWAKVRLSASRYATRKGALH